MPRFACPPTDIPDKDQPTYRQRAAATSNHLARGYAGALLPALPSRRAASRCDERSPAD